MFLENSMKPYQREFIQFLLKHQALTFGEFKLKSGRISPYFFNSGVFHDGEALNKLGYFYASAIINAQINYDVLFGPAYKGIPLVCTTAISLATHYKHNAAYCFNRKEVKDHGEGGNIVGAPLKGRVLIIDDVITAGTAIRESMQLITAAHATPAGIVIAMDRQERGRENISAITEIEQTYATQVISIIKLQDVIDYLSEQKDLKEALERICSYQQQYGLE